MRKLFPLIILSISFCLGCGNHGKQYYEGYDEGYSHGYDDAYREYTDSTISYDDVLQYVRQNYEIAEVYTQDELTEYITDIYYPDDLYDYDALIDCLINAGYVVSKP